MTRRSGAVGVGVGVLIVASAVLVALLVRASSGGAATATAAAFLVVAPAVAVAGPLRRADALSRTVLALGAVLAVDTVVAQTMVSADAWSRPGGVLAVGLISGAVWTVLWRRAAGPGTATAPARATAGSREPR
ncbi:hypothetical protein [uncultured Modestobacter sp.]|uniref:hypothetical protein n=1 Tax=uncultured Modestobacter sp. TaxID=380048 RepID=UPI0026384BDC|nr:hypothetical protein [uncultured Modestobacter sp.]